jgi:GTPase SAR1 family protein
MLHLFARLNVTRRNVLRLTTKKTSCFDLTPPMQVWDTAGGTATLNRLGPSFWRKAAAFLYVFNVSDVSSFNVLTALRSLLQNQVRR